MFKSIEQPLILSMYSVLYFCNCLANKKPPFNSARMLGGIGSYGTIQRYNGHRWKGFCGTDSVGRSMENYYQEMGYVNSSTLNAGPR